MVKVSDTLFGFEIIKCVAIGFISNETNHTTRHEKACNMSGKKGLLCCVCTIAVYSKTMVLYLESHLVILFDFPNY